MHIFDLEERTLNFSKKIIYLCKSAKREVVDRNLVDQLVRSGTSIGANYREANETDSKRDFANRIKIAKKEAKETSYWLDLLCESDPSLTKDILPIRDECNQLVKILSAIYVKSV